MSNRAQSWLAARWVAVLFLLWNFIGIGALVMQWTTDLTELAKIDPYQAQTFAQMPGWAWAAYAIAVATGTLSAIFLVMRNKLAVILAGVEVVAVLVQFGYTFFGTDLMMQKSAAETVPLPAAIIIIAILQFLYGRWLAGKGMLR